MGLPNVKLFKIKSLYRPFVHLRECPIRTGEDKTTDWISCGWSIRVELCNEH